MTNTPATLRDQIVIRPSFLGAEEQAARGIAAETVLSARVGRGTERHAVRITVWEATEDRPHPMAGQMLGSTRMPDVIKGQPRHWSSGRTYCGSQRAGSSATAYSMTDPVTCERCLGSGWSLTTESYPEDVLVEGRFGRLEVQA